MTHVLDAILRAKQEEIAELSKIKAEPRVARGPRKKVVSSLGRPSGEPLRLVAEIKRRSPSAGRLSTVLSVADRALAYARAGASMVSVLTDARSFDGSWAHVVEARRALDDAGLVVPILAKEFVLHPRQLEEAAACGADAVLLIARIVDHETLGVLVRRARELSLEPLVEVVTDEELSAALDADAKVIGVNTRDLDTLAMDPSRAARLLAKVPSDRIAVHLSGLKGPDDVRVVSRTDVDAALIGEALMREDDPSSLLRAMLLAAHG
jgi:indole-3-glycerol phosphate synthase